MCVCETNTASIGSRTAAGVRSIRPRSRSSARPCQRSVTSSAGSPVCPFRRRGRKVVFTWEPWPSNGPPAIRRDHACAGARPLSDLPLQLLQDERRRFAHHLLHDLAYRFLGDLELRDQTREDREVALLAVEPHGGQATLHRLHEASMRRGDLPVEVLAQGALVHARSIGRRIGGFNARAASVLCALLVA